MTTFFESDDLMRHMFNYIGSDNTWRHKFKGVEMEKNDRQSATLVCKKWRDLSHTMPTWRTANFEVLLVDGPHMEPTSPRFLGVSKFSLKEILVQRKHIVQFTL